MIKVRSNLSRKYMGAVLILIAFAGTSIHLGYSQSETLEFTIETEKSNYLLGEPVAIEFNLKNISPNAVDTELFPPYDHGAINIMITQGDSDPVNLISEKMTVGMESLLAIEPITLNSGESTTSTEFISFNLLTEDLAFTEPSEYQIQAMLILGEDSTLESNTVNIIVSDVTGMNDEALSFLEANGLLMFLTHEVQFASESLDPILINKANEFLVNFPDSIYSGFVGSTLDVIEQMSISECPQDMIGIYPDCEPKNEITFEDIITMIEIMNLHSGTENSLIVKINSASKNFDKDNPKTALNNLNAFINYVNAQTKKQISEDDSAILVEAVNQIVGQLELLESTNLQNPTLDNSQS